MEFDSELRELIENTPIAFATSDGAGNPNVIGVAFVKVVSNNQLLITDNFMKQTKENLEKNNRVCLAVWDDDWNGHKLVGTAEYFTEGKWKTFVENMPENKGLPAKGAVLVSVSRVIKLS